MAAQIPFSPDTKSGAAGKTITLTVATTVQQLGQINTVLGESPSLLVTMINPSASITPFYLRMSVESSTTITATNTDTPLAPTSATPVIRLFANPSPTGVSNYAVVCTVAPSTPATLFLTPGEGGV